VYGCAAGVECGDAGGCDDGDLFVAAEGEAFEERGFPGSGFAGEEDVAAGAVDELQRGVHGAGELGVVVYVFCGLHARVCCFFLGRFAGVKIEKWREGWCRKT
jgi:hypothetical protein